MDLRDDRVSARATSPKLDVLVGGEPVDALSLITHRSKARCKPKLVEKLKTIIPRQMFEVPLQAAIAAR